MLKLQTGPYSMPDLNFARFNHHPSGFSNFSLSLSLNPVKILNDNMLPYANILSGSLPASESLSAAYWRLRAATTTGSGCCPPRCPPPPTKTGPSGWSTGPPSTRALYRLEEKYSFDISYLQFKFFRVSVVAVSFTESLSFPPENFLLFLYLST